MASKRNHQQVNGLRCTSRIRGDRAFAPRLACTLHWVERFLRYLGQTGREAGSGRYVINAGSVRDYLSYLATGERVGASTQNQAFHALLFLCREILLLGDPQLETGARAKRGQRLPVVLTDRVRCAWVGGNASVRREEEGAGTQIGGLGPMRPVWDTTHGQ